ncbi:unnamed protein product [Brugia timori]|uniref:Secreted protein n=1 Tax=Brugia timori TaxID=42155 RepID=A0A0R3RAH1_9BILA|nr:unnamed protein product [Brugia timori]
MLITMIIIIFCNHMISGEISVIMITDFTSCITSSHISVMEKIKEQKVNYSFSSVC